MYSLNFVASICHPKKLGLLDHAKALNYYGQAYDCQRDYVVLLKLSDLICLIRKSFNTNGTGLCVVWDNSLRSLIIALIARMFGFVVTYYYHEPGGFGQKIFKSDPFIYSLKAALGEWIFLKITHFHIIARPDKIGFGDVFCPLLFCDRRPVRKSKQDKLIGFLGAKRNQRLHNLFILLSPHLVKAGYQIGFFPSLEFGSSSTEKIQFLSRCVAVWNVYGVPYNQSGVTGDCLMSDVPVICSNFEPYRRLLRQLNLGIELDLMLPQYELMQNLLNELVKKETVNNEVSRVFLSECQSNFGGQQAFIKHWKSFFDSLQS